MKINRRRLRIRKWDGSGSVQRHLKTLGLVLKDLLVFLSLLFPLFLPLYPAMRWFRILFLFLSSPTPLLFPSSLLFVPSGLLRGASIIFQSSMLPTLKISYSYCLLLWPYRYDTMLRLDFAREADGRWPCGRYLLLGVLGGWVRGCSSGRSCRERGDRDVLSGNEGKIWWNRKKHGVNDFPKANHWVS